MIEVLCGTVWECELAQACGADRIELNNGTPLGGLTPSFATFLRAKEKTSLPFMVMVRARGYGFSYNEDEFETMLYDAKLFLEQGAEGIVFGFLTEDRQIDIPRTKTMTDLIHSYGSEAVFHRAFDNVRDPYEAIEILIELGIDRILTGGQEHNAYDGIERLKDLHDKYGTKIKLLPGGGVTAENMKEILERTGIREIHGSFKHYVSDPTTHRLADNDKVSEYFVVDKDHLERAVRVYQSID